jgi:CheY-like chemotaxis protein
MSIPAEQGLAEPKPKTERGPASIVIAEDDPDIRALIELYLEQTPHRLRFAEDGLQAVQTVLEDPPDLVLMDVQMPKMDGLRATQRLRQGGYRNPIVALTGACSRSDQQQAMTAGCDYCLFKPLQMEQLLGAIDQMLDSPNLGADRLR